MQQNNDHTPSYIIQTSYSQSYTPLIEHISTFDYKNYGNTEIEITKEENIKSNNKIESYENDEDADSHYLAIPKRSNLVDAINFDLKRSPVYFINLQYHNIYKLGYRIPIECFEKTIPHKTRKLM